jgi:dephospho-CoA kinase
VSLFGKNILTKSDQIDRQKLAHIVFADSTQLARQNDLIHPIVLDRVEQLMVQYSTADDVPAIVLDMPLLVETGWEKKCDRLIFVDCKRQTRAKRAQKMGISDESQLRKRENFQNPLDTKADLADNTIDNNFGYSELARQVAEIFSFVVDNE